jgi:hypothetical protein
MSGLDRRLAKLEERGRRQSPDDGGADDLGLPETDDWNEWDKWFATHVPRMIEAWLYGPGESMGSTEHIWADGPFAGDAAARRAWALYSFMARGGLGCSRADGEVFDFWYPNRDAELYALKLAFVRQAKRVLAASSNAWHKFVATLFPRDDGEADDWAPRHPPLTYDPARIGGVHAEAARCAMFDPRRIDYRRRWLTRMAAEGDGQAAEDLAALEREVAEYEREVEAKRAEEAELPSCELERAAAASPKTLTRDG